MSKQRNTHSALRKPVQEYLRQALERVEVEGSVQKALQLSQVVLFVACGWCGSRFTSSIPSMWKGERERWQFVAGVL